MGRRLLVVAVAVCALAQGSCSLNDPPGGEGRMSIATGGSGGVYQVYGGGVADMLSENGHATTAEATSASVDNLYLVADGNSDIAFSLADTAIDAVEGQESFEEPLPLRALGTLYSNFTHVVALKNSGIRRIEDLKGKTVSIGAPNSGTEVIGLRLMEVAGLDPDEDVTRRAMGVGESSAALREGSIDAFVWSGGLPTGAITDLATTEEIVLLPLDGYLEELNRRYGEAYTEADVEEGEYPGVAPVKTIAVPNLLMVREDMDAALAHDVIALMFSNQKALADVHPAAENLVLEDTREVVEPVKLHPGAERYYEEADQ
jgi:TRAP transporter TAXI family solute receptor